MATRIGRGYGQYGGVARALERVGERWALLIVRDLLAGPRRYSDLKAGLPRIPTNILSDRLRELQDAGVVRRAPIVRGGYELTELGRALAPVVTELERWGWQAAGAAGEEDLLPADALASTLRAAFRPAEAADLPPTEYVVRVGAVSISAIVRGDDLDLMPVGPGALPQPHRRVEAERPEDLLELRLAPDDLRALLVDRRPPGGVDPELARRFARTFGFDPVDGDERVARGDRAA